MLNKYINALEFILYPTAAFACLSVVLCCVKAVGLMPLSRMTYSTVGTFIRVYRAPGTAEKACITFPTETTVIASATFTVRTGLDVHGYK